MYFQNKFEAKQPDQIIDKDKVLLDLDDCIHRPNDKQEPIDNP